jgi:hypothetical protein
MSASRGKADLPFESSNRSVRGVADGHERKTRKTAWLAGARPTLRAPGANGILPSQRRWFWPLPNAEHVESRQIRCCGGQRAHVAVRGAEEQKKRRNAAEVVGVVVQCGAVV